ncbi:cucumisin-like [Herrania umbratica]|uniref:Cucumisin-like n=1 Tax=Herrania umbratica TaxID=108875 RepID=A0A6J1AXL1_9ROSI|nr:cucumisin-like [Herrania umbratica]
MAKKGLIPLVCSLLFAAFLLNSHAANANERKIHVVYMGDRLKGDLSSRGVHHSMMTSVLGSSLSAKESLVYSYGNFNAFAAKLTEEEVKRFSEMDGVVRVIPNHILQLHTTRSWDFLGFSQSSLGAKIEGDVVIGLLDTGIWPEHDSFTNQGLGAPPSKWKGICQGANFSCNNKIVGARYYNSEEWYSDTDFKSPRDSEGHGTHTSSTAGGNRVADASYYGLANGTARGGVPGARIAIYVQGFHTFDTWMDLGMLVSSETLSSVEGNYINFLCKQGYNTTTIRLITGDNSSVCTSTTPGPAWDLNYPSFSLAVLDGQPIYGVFTRTVTNVGSPNSNYTVWKTTQGDFTISVEPEFLSFSTVGEKKSFTVRVTGPHILQQPITSGSIVWLSSDYKYRARSPVVVYNVLPTPYSPYYSKSQKKPTFQRPSMYQKNGILGRN